MILRSVGVLSVGKFMGIAYAILGLVFGAIFSLISLVAGSANVQGGNPIPMAGIGIAAIIVLPIMYGILGFIVGVISAAIYNFVAGFAGGIEMDFERRQPIAPTT